MTTIRFKLTLWLGLAVFVTSALLGVGLVLLPTQSAQALPLRLTVTPTPAAEAPPLPKPTGGFIRLYVQLPETWPWPYRWQDLWTVVQWKDQWGSWHDISGWQGMLDEVEGSEGKKLWWVANAYLGKGPFRWQVTQGRGGRLLATSEEFYLPETTGDVVRVEVALAP
jgi:hypothetical protein